MGWVTLSLRKQALKQEHSYYQLRLLQISREKRQLHRKKSAEIKGVQVEQNQTLREARETYNSAREAKNNAMKTLRSEYKTYKEGEQAAGNQNIDSLNEFASSAGNYNDIIETFEQAQLDYQEEKDLIKTDYEFEQQDIEEEAADEELALDMEQTEIEAQIVKELKIGAKLTHIDGHKQKSKHKSKQSLPKCKQ